MTLQRSVPALAVLLLTGCAALVPDAERVQIQQGNLLSEADIDRLAIGQSRERVRELIGTPIMASPFRADRWDYVYFDAEAGRRVEDPQRLTLYFDDTDAVSRIEDRYQPPEKPLEDQGTIPTVDTRQGGAGPADPGTDVPSPLPDTP